MDFGNWRRFGVECCIEHAMLLLPQRLSSVQGRIRVWVGGTPIGSLDQWGVSLPQVLESLQSLGDEGAARWHPELATLSAVERHAALQLTCYGVDQPPLSLDPRLLPAVESGSFHERVKQAAVLTNDAETFDGWSVFVLQPPELDELHWSWRTADGAGVSTAITATGETRRVVAEFGAWLADEQRNWAKADR